MKTLICFLLILSQYCFSQKPKPFKTCSKTVNYIVDDWELRKKFGMDLAIPDCNPTYAGGAEELMKFLKANSINESIHIFRASICFVVNCKGQIGNFQIVNSPDEDLVKQVFEVIKKMPQKWRPATSKDGKPVDSYQMLTVTVKSSKFLDVYYK